MNGPEYYREAERLLAREAAGEGVYGPIHQRDMDRAQVHATLALAAATALPHITDDAIRAESFWGDWAAAILGPVI